MRKITGITASASGDAAKPKAAIDRLRYLWYKPSYLLDRRQSGETCAKARFDNYKNQPLQFSFNKSFSGQMSQYGISPDRKPSGIKAAIIREKGTNGEREMAYALYLAGFDVKDVHATDLATGRETLEDVNFVVFCGGFSNSDVLGSAKGWAGGLLFNEKAKAAIDNFYARPDTLSILPKCRQAQLCFLPIVHQQLRWLNSFIQKELHQKVQKSNILK